MLELHGLCDPGHGQVLGRRRGDASVLPQAEDFMALSGARMQWLRGAWALIPLLGLLEVVLHFAFSERAADAQDWEKLPGLVEQLRRPGDRVVITPEWAEPLARSVLGDGVMPMRDLARPDISGWSFALEVALFDAEAPELASFTTLATLDGGPFSLRRLKNPNFVPVLYHFDDHVRPEQLQVTEPDGQAEKPCPFTNRAAASAGGLPGHPSYPRARFRCSGGEPFFVGVTIVDDQRYQPRRCLLAHPPRQGGPLRLRFSNVPPGRAITGAGGLPYLLFRDGLGPPVTIAVFVNDRKVGESTHRDEAGFTPFRFEIGSSEAIREVRFEVTSPSGRNRPFCFSAELR